MPKCLGWETYKDSVFLTPLIQVLRGHPLALRWLNLVLYACLANWSDNDYYVIIVAPVVKEEGESHFLEIGYGKGEKNESWI